MSLDNTDRFLKVFRLRSGFTIGVKPLPPYYMDLLDMAYPLLDMPKRRVHLLAGDTYEYKYDMPEEPPGEGDEDYDIYMQAKYVLERNEELRQVRQSARRDMLLSNCVEILEGHEEYTDEAWVQEVEAFAAADDFHLPNHPGLRRLLFIKMRVLTDTKDAQQVVGAALYEEVSEQGIYSALRGFQD